MPSGPYRAMSPVRRRRRVRPSGACQWISFRLGQVGAVEVVAGEANTADMEFTRHPDGYELASGVENVRGLVGHRTAVRDASPFRVAVGDLVDGRVNGGFRDATESNEPYAR